MYLVRAYGLLGLSGALLGDHEAGDDVVKRGRRAEHHARLQPSRLQGVEQFQRFGHVLAVILVGVRDRFGHDDQRGAVHGGLDIGVLAGRSARARLLSAISAL